MKKFELFEVASFFHFSPDVTNSTVLLFLKFSIVLSAMKESMNESIHKN